MLSEAWGKTPNVEAQPTDKSAAFGRSAGAKGWAVTNAFVVGYFTYLPSALTGCRRTLPGIRVSPPYGKERNSDKHHAEREKDEACQWLAKRAGQTLIQQIVPDIPPW